MGTHLTIKEIHTRIKQNTYTTKEMKQWRKDERKGVSKLLQAMDRQMEKKEELKSRYIEMSTYETELERKGLSLIAGIDEAGRGPLAGPVVAAAVILPKHAELYGLTDSKLLSEKERQYFYENIKEVAVSYHIQAIPSEVIDEINIYEATKKAMTEAVHSLHVHPEHVLIDAVPLELKTPTTVLTKGDQKSISIAAASVLAKVYRDSYMKEIDREFPQYCFAQHKGYGTKDHLNALQTYGVSPYHRKSFTPVKHAISHRS